MDFAKGLYYRQIRDMFFKVYLANISLIFYFFGEHFANKYNIFSYYTIRKMATFHSDYYLKSCIFVDVDDLLITGRSSYPLTFL
jgi:hypothetical protein